MRTTSWRSMEVFTIQENIQSYGNNPATKIWQTFLPVQAAECALFSPYRNSRPARLVIKECPCAWLWKAVSLNQPCPLRLTLFCRLNLKLTHQFRPMPPERVPFLTKPGPSLRGQTKLPPTRLSCQPEVHSPTSIMLS